MSELPNPHLDVLGEDDTLGATAEAVLPSAHLAPDQRLLLSAAMPPAKMRKVSTTGGPTAREYHVLRILDCYGWCTPEMVRRIANFHGVPWTSEGRLTYRLLRRLKELGFVVSRKLHDGTKTIANAATPNGMAYIRSHGDALLCDTNAVKDPASVFHFIGLNNIMLQFMSQFPTRYWLSDFQVRSDNSCIGANGLAKDYDSVGELALSTGHVRIAVEYERWQQSSHRYLKLCACLASEKYLHMVIYFLGKPELLRSAAPHFKRLGGFVYFVDYGQFLAKGADVYAHYWYLGHLYEAPLRDVLDHASRKQRLDYFPIHQLTLRMGK